MADRYRSPAARELAKAIKSAGGTVERAGAGRLRVSGPNGVVTIQEPSGESRRDLRRSSAARLIEERTGLKLT